MPGLVGIVSSAPRHRLELELRRMLQALAHDDSYVSGTWLDETLGVYVGWTARKGSFAADMPVRNEAADVTLVFSGEEFPDPRTAAQLAARGHQVNATAASYLPHVYEEGPSSFYVKLNGRFHGLLVDHKRRTVTLFNDRYGMHRVYCHESDDGFYFAAEAKAILAVRADTRHVESQGLGEFISCGCVLENRTLFHAVRLLPVAAMWTITPQGVESRATYFQPEIWEQQEQLDHEAYYRRIREVFSQNLPRYFGGNEPVGMSLTGGLDTRMIMAWHHAAPGTLPCYTFGGMYRDCHDVVIARRVARVCGQDHQVIPVGEQFLARFAHYAQRTVYLTDGCVEVTRSPDLYVNEIARQIAPVRMTGNYGGEVLRRVRAFKPIELHPGLFQEELIPYIEACRQTYRGLLDKHPLSFAMFNQQPWWLYGSLSLEQTQLAPRSPFLDNDFVQTAFRGPGTAFADNGISLRLIADGNPTLGAVPTDRGIGGNDAARRLLEFSFKAEYGYDHGMPQWVAQVDHVLRHLRLERLFLGRHKFYHFRVWYRDFLANYVRDVLLDPRSLSRPYLNPSVVRTVVQSHLKGNRNYTREIHKLLTLELLHRLFLDSPSALGGAAAADRLVEPPNGA